MSLWDPMDHLDRRQYLCEMSAWGDLLLGDGYFHWHDGLSTEIHTFPDEMIKSYPSDMEWIWKGV